MHQRPARCHGVDHYSVIIKCPDRAATEAFYGSPEYAQLRAIDWQSAERGEFAVAHHQHEGLELALHREQAID